MEGGIFSSTFELYRKGFKPFALVAICYYILITIYNLLMNLCVYGKLMINPFDYKFSPQLISSTLPFLFLMVFLLIIVVFIYAIFMKLLVSSVDTEEPIDYRELLNASIKKLPKLLLLSLLLGLGYILLVFALALVSVIVGLIVMIPIAFFLPKSSLFFTGPIIITILIVLMCFGIIPFLVRLSLCFTIAVLEDIDPIESLKKSWNLVRGAGWRIFGYELAIYSIIIAVTLINMGITTVLTRTLGAANFITITVSFLIGLLVTIIGPIFAILLYRIYRWRNIPPVEVLRDISLNQNNLEEESGQ